MRHDPVSLLIYVVVIILLVWAVITLVGAIG